MEMDDWKLNRLWLFGSVNENMGMLQKWCHDTIYFFEKYNSIGGSSVKLEALIFLYFLGGTYFWDGPCIKYCSLNSAEKNVEQ